MVMGIYLYPPRSLLLKDNRKADIDWYPRRYSLLLPEPNDRVSEYEEFGDR